MNQKFKDIFTAKHILIGLTSLCLLFIGLSFLYGDAANPVKNAVNKVVLPMQKGINSVGSRLFSSAEELAALKDAQEENAKLKEQIASLQQEISLSEQERYDLQTLRELYELDAGYSDYEKVGARVIGKDSGNWFHYFLIDKGAADGIEVNMNVIAQGGLVGIVTEVRENSAKVLAIIDDESNVSATSLASQDSCMISGDLKLYQDGVLSLMYVDKDAPINEGDKIVTSSTSNKFLPGILIGYVKSIEVDANNLTKSGTLIPVVDFEHIDTVLVITTLKEGWDSWTE